MKNIHSYPIVAETGNFQNIPALSVNSKTISEQLRMLSRSCPQLQTARYGRSVMGKSLLAVKIGCGPRRVLFSAAHHANEWVGTWVLMKFVAELCQKSSECGALYNVCTEEILKRVTIFLVPMVNPDGVDLATGLLSSGRHYESAKKIAESYPDVPFPTGWKANLKGVDLNLQYPAGWQAAKKIKAAMGFAAPAPLNYVGVSPLCAPESAALFRLTQKLSPALVLALHSQGEVIYWKYGSAEPKGSRELGQLLASVSGYALEETPEISGNAGYKDWFIKEYDRPGYTVELGLGTNPLPVEQFSKIYKDIMPLLVYAALGCMPARFDA